mgnify:CR=1 FL=1
MSRPFTTRIDNGIAEMILDHPPVNAFDSAGWFSIAAEIDALGSDDAVRVITAAIGLASTAVSVLASNISTHENMKQKKAATPIPAAAPGKRQRGEGGDD